KPPRTAATTSAFRLITQRFVPGAGRSAMVRGLPSGPMTYFTLGRWGSVIGTLTHCTVYAGGMYFDRLKIYLSRANQLEFEWRNWGRIGAGQAPVRRTRLILSMVKFCPPTERTGGFWVRSTESTTPCTSVGTATLSPLASLATTD